MKKLVTLIALMMFVLAGCGGGGGGENSGNSNGGGIAPTVQTFEASPDGIVVDGYENQFPDYQEATLSWEVSNADGHTVEIGWTEGDVIFCSSYSPQYSKNCPSQDEIAPVQVTQVPPVGSMVVRPKQDTTYYLIVDGQPAMLWENMPASVNVYVYDPNFVVGHLKMDILEPTVAPPMITTRWLDGTVHVYDPGVCPDQYVRDTVDFLNSKLPDNIRLEVVDDPNAEVEIVDGSSFPGNHPAWNACEGADYNGGIRGTHCKVIIHDMNNICGPYASYEFSIRMLAHELGHVLGIPHTATTKWEGTPYDEARKEFYEEVYDQYRRPTLMNGDVSTANGGEGIEVLETQWTPLIDIFFRYLYSLPIGTCLDNRYC